MEPITVLGTPQSPGPLQAKLGETRLAWKGLGYDFHEVPYSTFSLMEDSLNVKNRTEILNTSRDKII